MDEHSVFFSIKRSLVSSSVVSRWNQAIGSSIFRYRPYLCFYQFREFMVSDDFSRHQYWSALASSAGGMKLYAAVNGGPIYCSTNSGISWQSNNSPSNSWTSMTVSADGTKVAAASTSLIYGSTNSGLTWVPLSAPSIGWNSICSSLMEHFWRRQVIPVILQPILEPVGRPRGKVFIWSLHQPMAAS